MVPNVPNLLIQCLFSSEWDSELPCCGCSCCGEELVLAVLGVGIAEEVVVVEVDECPLP